MQTAESNNDRLTRTEAIALFENSDLHDLAARALAEKRKRFGEQVFWIRNLHLNYTNICQGHCKVCHYFRRKGEPDAYVLTVEQAVDRVAEAAGQGAKEVHIVGGINPDLPFGYYLDLIGELRKRFPALYIRAFTAAEIDFMGKVADLPIEAVLEKLILAGLNAMPGGGAEIFSGRVRRELFPNKISADRWLEIHRRAHRAGLETNATMLFGHLETPAERVDHLLKLRELQDETGGFKAFVPLPVVGFGEMKGVDGLDALRTLAVSRLLLDNFDHIKVFWPIWGLKLSQLALSYGGDDFDGTVGRYKIIDHSGLSPETLQTLITQAGFTPVSRDSRYNSPA